MNMPPEPSPVEAHPKNDHERTDVRVAGILKAGVGLAVVVGLCLFGLTRLTASLEHAVERSDPALSPMSGSQTPPTPRLQTQPRDALTELRAEEQAKLDGYRWVERKNNVVEVPIERAMQLLAERGFPEPAATVPTATGTGTAKSQANSPDGKEAPK